jgi:hypothetical protein
MTLFSKRAQSERKKSFIADGWPEGACSGQLLWLKA